MMGKIALALCAVVVWAALGIGLVYLDADNEADDIGRATKPVLDNALDALARANQAWLSARLDEVEAAAAALGTEKVATPAAGHGKKAADAQPASQPAADLVTHAEAAVQRLSGAPAYAVVGEKGDVMGGTLWPEAQNVRGEPSVQSALLGVARVSFWRKDAALFVLASSPILENGQPKNVLVIAKPVGKETCTELGQFSHVAPFALMLDAKPACAQGGDAALLARGAGHTQTAVLAQAISPAPMFVEAGKIGTAVQARAFRPEIPGSEIVVGDDVRPAFSALAQNQQHRLMMHAALLVPILLFVMILLFVLIRPVAALSNELSLQLQQNKDVALDERQFSGRIQRLAKNINTLAARAPAKGPPVPPPSVQALLGKTNDIPAPLPKAPPAPPAEDRSSLFDDDDFKPTLAEPKSSPPPVAPTPPPAPTPTAPPARAKPPAAPPLDDDDDRTLISRSLPTDSLRFDEKPLFGEGSTLPDLPDNEPTPSPLSPLTGSEADSALSALDEASAPAPLTTKAGASPWDEDPPVAAPPPPAAPVSAVTADDPDMPHFHDVYDQFVRTRAQCGEGGELTFERFLDKLKKSRDQVLQKQGAARVRFQVYVKDGKAALKAVAFR